MIDPQTCSEAERLLAAVVGMLMGDGAPVALRAPEPAPSELAEALRVMGADIVILAAAMAVLALELKKS